MIDCAIMTAQSRLFATLIATIIVPVAACGGTDASTTTGGRAGSSTLTASGGRTSTTGSNTGGTSLAGTAGTTTEAGGAATSELATQCSTLCLRIIEKGCPKNASMTTADCDAECDSTVLADLPCMSEYGAWMKCFLAQPSSTWICDDGVAAPPASVCDAENTVFTECLG